MRTPFGFRTGTKYDVAGFGTNAVDHLIRVDRYPDFNTKVEVRDYAVLPGGEVASTLVGLQRLGLSTSYAGSFGDDEAGSIGRTSLVSEGVDISLSRTISGANTQVGFIIVDLNSGERTVLWKRDAALAYSPEDAPLEIPRSAKVLHMTPHDTEAATKMAEAARDAGTIVSLDIDHAFEGVERLLALTDIAIASSDFLTSFTGTRDKLSAMTEIRSRYGCGIVGVTLGSAGSYLLCEGTFIDTPAYSVPGGCVDTTGAGDAFRAGLLFGLLTGMDVEDAAQSANAVAALKCRAEGARTSLPTVSDIREMLG